MDYEKIAKNFVLPFGIGFALSYGIARYDPLTISKMLPAPVLKLYAKPVNFALVIGIVVLLVFILVMKGRGTELYYTETFGDLLPAEMYGYGGMAPSSAANGIQFDNSIPI